MILGSAEEDDNTLQFYQIVADFLFRRITFISWNMRKMWSFSGNSASPEMIGLYSSIKINHVNNMYICEIFEEKLEK